MLFHCHCYVGLVDSQLHFPVLFGQLNSICHKIPFNFFKYSMYYIIDFDDLLQADLQLSKFMHFFSSFPHFHSLNVLFDILLQLLVGLNSVNLCDVLTSFVTVTRGSHIKRRYNKTQAQSMYSLIFRNQFDYFSYFRGSSKYYEFC